MKKRELEMIFLLTIFLSYMVLLSANPFLFGHRSNEISGLSWNRNVGKIEYSETSPENGHSTSEIKDIVWFENSSKKVGTITKPGTFSVLQRTINILKEDKTPLSSIEVISQQRISNIDSLPEYSLIIRENLPGGALKEGYSSGWIKDIKTLGKGFTVNITTETKRLGMIFLVTNETTELEVLKSGAGLGFVFCEFTTKTSQDWNGCLSKIIYAKKTQTTWIE